MMNKPNAVLFLVLLGQLSTSPYELSAQQPPPANGDVAQLVARLGSDAPLFDKAKACQQLSTIGTKEAVNALAHLLTDETLAHYARYALEPIPESAVDDAFRAALDKVNGKLLIGVISSVATRRDDQAVDRLTELLHGGPPEVAEASAFALARIANTKSIQVLRKALRGSAALRKAASQACLVAAEVLMAREDSEKAEALYEAVRTADVPKHIQLAAMQSTLRLQGADALSLIIDQLQATDNALAQVAFQATQELRSNEATDALMEAFSQLPESRQVLLIHVLSERNNANARRFILKAARHNARQVRAAAVQVLSSVGDESAVPVLWEAAVGNDKSLASQARDSLVAMQGSDIDVALLTLLERSTGRNKVVALEVAGRRGIETAIPILLKAADDDDSEIRSAAVQALGLSVSLDELGILIDRLLQAEHPDDITATNKALRTACLRMPNVDACAGKLLHGMTSASAQTQSHLMDLLGLVGGSKALAGVSEAARTGTEELQNAATRVLGRWPTPDAAPVLLELASTGNKRFRVRTLRGYIRVIRQFGLPAGERLAMCRRALAAATRDQERRLVLSTLPRFPSKAAMKLALENLDNPALKEAASLSVVTMANRLLDKHPALIVEATRRVTASTSEPETRRRAEELLRRANAKLSNP